MKRWLALWLVAAMVPAHAALIATDATGERERVLALMARPEVARELEKRGLAPQDASARVRAMSDEEVHALAQAIDAAPAGGQPTRENLLIFLVILLVLIILL